jgi:biopolymer transport protein ExbD
MFIGIANQFRSSERSQAFNMTPVIDIVFLLIIFFLVVCQFIEDENFPVAVPDGCEFASPAPESRARFTTITVMKDDTGEVNFAVGAKKITASDGSDLTEQIACLVDAGLKDLTPDRRVVTLRIDRHVCFADAQYALAAVAQSSATDVQLAALKNKRPVPE